MLRPHAVPSHTGALRRCAAQRVGSRFRPTLLAHAFGPRFRPTLLAHAFASLRGPRCAATHCVLVGSRTWPPRKAPAPHPRAAPLASCAQVRAENVRLTSEMEARTRDLTEIATMSGAPGQTLSRSPLPSVPSLSPPPHPLCLPFRVRLRLHLRLCLEFPNLIRVCRTWTPHVAPSHASRCR
eukprot:3715359-Prymnesium_polylepis.1